MLLTHDQWEKLGQRLPDHHFLIIHETDGPANQTIQEINDYHQQHNGWVGIGYHRLTYQDGTIHECRPDDIVGAQAQGLNMHSIGCAYVGTFAHSLPPKAQYDGMVHCCAVECLRWGIPVKNIIGHRDVAKLIGDPSVATDCPGDPIYYDLPNFRAKVVQEMDRIQKAGG